MKKSKIITYIFGLFIVLFTCNGWCGNPDPANEIMSCTFNVKDKNDVNHEIYLRWNFYGKSEANLTPRLETWGPEDGMKDDYLDNTRGENRGTDKAYFVTDPKSTYIKIIVGQYKDKDYWTLLYRGGTNYLLKGIITNPQTHEKQKFYTPDTKCINTF
ncbi:MAG TPA: hypothetical protein VKR58_13155 [Aquella sp.]|nr:hypothetical protein [Aquella sp.]